MRVKTHRATALKRSEPCLVASVRSATTWRHLQTRSSPDSSSLNHRGCWPRYPQHSTGPRTPAGKAVAAMNARTHGILSEAAPVLPTEDAAAYAELRDRMHQDAAPVGVVEQALVDRLAMLLWRMRRLAVVEAALFAWHQAHAAREEASARQRATTADPLDVLLARATVLDADGHAEAAADEDAAAMAQRTPALLLASAFRDDLTAFAVLSRYEAGLETRFRRALEDLTRQQAGRLPNEPTEAKKPMSVRTALTVTCVLWMVACRTHRTERVKETGLSDARRMRQHADHAGEPGRR